MYTRNIALIWLFIPCVVAADDQINRFKATLHQKMLSSYQLTFTVTNPVYKPLPVYEKITRTYSINASNGHRLSVITKKINGKLMISRKLVTPKLVTIHDDESPYVDKYTTNEGKGKYKEHDIDYIKLGKHPRSIGAIVNNQEEEDYVEHFMKNKYLGKKVDKNGVVTHSFKGKNSVFTLKFHDQSASFPTYVSITAPWGKEGKSIMIDAINCDYSEHSQVPIKVEYTRTVDNVVQERQVISDIKLEAVDSKLTFTEKELGIKINTDAIVDNTFSKFWDGETFSEKPVAKNTAVIRTNYFYVINGFVLVLLGIMILLYSKFYRKRTIKNGLHAM